MLKYVFYISFYVILKQIGHLDDLNAFLRCTACVLSIFKLNGSVSSLFVTNDTAGQGGFWLRCVNGTSRYPAMIGEGLLKVY